MNDSPVVSIRSQCWRGCGPLTALTSIYCPHLRFTAFASAYPPSPPRADVLSPPGQVAAWRPGIPVPRDGGPSPFPSSEPSALPGRPRGHFLPSQRGLVMAPLGPLHLGLWVPGGPAVRVWGFPCLSELPSHMRPLQGSMGRASPCAAGVPSEDTHLCVWRWVGWGWNGRAGATTRWGSASTGPAAPARFPERDPPCFRGRLCWPVSQALTQGHRKHPNTVCPFVSCLLHVSWPLHQVLASPACDTFAPVPWGLRAAP